MAKTAHDLASIVDAVTDSKFSQNLTVSGKDFSFGILEPTGWLLGPGEIEPNEDFKQQTESLAHLYRGNFR